VTPVRRLAQPPLTRPELPGCHPIGPMTNGVAILMSQYTFQLMTRHQQVDAALRSEQKRRLPDFFRMQRLKKIKLALKDRLARLMAR